MTNSIDYRKNIRILKYDNKKSVRKQRKTNSRKIYNYLKIKHFDNYLLPCEITKEFEYYPYIEEKDIPREEKAIELMHVLSMLHIKTSSYQEKNISNIKKTYEETKKQIEDLRYYYYNLQDVIEYKVYPSPEEQLLLINISNFYKALNYAEYKIDAWYKEKENKNYERVVLNHNNLSLDHVLFNDKINLISWNYAKKDYPIYDFLNLYKNEFRNIEMTSLFKIYHTKFQYTKEEQLLFESLIAIPPKIVFDKPSLINTINTRKVVDYVLKTNAFLLEYNKEDKKNYEEEFK